LADYLDETRGSRKPVEHETEIEIER